MCEEQQAVCGTDGVTYLNMCQFREAAFSKPGLRTRGEGPCKTGRTPVCLTSCTPVCLRSCMQPVFLSTHPSATSPCATVCRYTCLSVYMSDCSPVHLPVWTPLPVYLCDTCRCTCLSVRLFTCLSAFLHNLFACVVPVSHTPFCLFTCLCFHLPNLPSSCLPGYLSVCLSAHLPVYQCDTCLTVYICLTHLSTRLSLHLSICQHMSVWLPV